MESSFYLSAQYTLCRPANHFYSFSLNSLQISQHLSVNDAFRVNLKGEKASLNELLSMLAVAEMKASSSEKADFNGTSG